jgi:hypothetical protein
MSHGGFSGSRGGFSSPHFGAPRSSGGFGAARPYHFAGTPRYARPSARYPYSRYRSGYRSGFRAPYNRDGRRGFRDRDGRRGFRDRDDDRFRRRFAGAFFYPDWIGLGPEGCYPDAQVYGGDFDDIGCDDLAAESDQPVINGDEGEYPPAPPPDYDQQPPPGYEQQPPPGYEQQPPPPGYEPPAYDPPARAPRSSPLPANQIATTIVFNDGRPPEQIHNYALTQSTLFVLDQQHRDIPLDQINLAATEKLNRAAGVDFRPPQ